jgi:hypothetical protein
MLTRASLPCPRHPPPRILRQGQILTALRDATDLMTLADIATAVDQWLHHTVRDGASCRKSASRWRSRRMRLTGSLRQSALPPRRGRSATARFSSRRSRGCYAHAKRSDLVTMIRQADIVGMASASWLNAVETFFTKLTRRRLERGHQLSSVVDHRRTQSAKIGPEVLVHDAVSVSPDFVRLIAPPGHVTEASFSPESHARSHFSPEHSWLNTCRPDPVWAA